MTTSGQATLKLLRGQVQIDAQPLLNGRNKVDRNGPSCATPFAG